MLFKLFFFCSCIAATIAINRPVYKVLLTQKGYAQFLQYDLETPPLIEFTFCTWVRLYNLANEQTFFTYIVNGNKNMVRLWVDPGGRNVQLAINGWLATTSPIEMTKDVWKHVCVSYQSDYGAWALYVDARLVTCGASQALHGFVLPPGGSVNIGYGTSDNGVPSGVEGEIFGANMILISTIERNYTMKQNPRFRQRHFLQNRIKKNRAEADNYIILNDLRENKIQNNFNSPNNPTFSGINFTTHQTTQEGSAETSNEREILDFAIPGRIRATTDSNNIQFWHLFEYGKENKLQRNKELHSAPTVDLPTVSEFETPPPPSVENTLRPRQKQKPGEKSNDTYTVKQTNQKNSQRVQSSFEVLEIETPPPPQDDNKVYGQWVSSKFAGSVFNHLRNIRFNKKELQPHPTISLPKLSDAYPYASEFQLTKLKPPVEFERRNLGVNSLYPDIFTKRRPQYNVQVLEDDIREKIIKAHSRLKAKNINVVSKGESKLTHDRFYRAAKYESSESTETIPVSKIPRPFKRPTNSRRPNEIQSSTNIKNQNFKNLLTALPFLKSIGDLIDDSEKLESNNEFKNDVYTRSLSNGNKWHNTKSYSNDYTPRHVNVDSKTQQDNLESKLANADNKHPAIKLKYKYQGRNQNETPMKHGQNLAKSVSSQAEIGLTKAQNLDSVSIQKYIYESLDDKNEHSYKTKAKNLDSINNFNKHVKIGNALNELPVIGRNEMQKKRSFEGGDARVPDINRYRSDIDKEFGNVPPSISPKVCKNVELYDRVLYIQPDESVDLTYFLSPVKLKNHAIEFIQQNYKMCSLDNSIFEKDPLLYLDWSRTPLRLFGGAYLQTTTDLCGFF
ncbi:uncharacterized protein LOC128683300 isoform X2 [Plodia interpunctella]|nr:uncharacterized protein LOC128683300 isoform X2 [Plodia interpunctella]XP_053624758.1 uncharacterized protein LOC128683300 isoform X2 [Plodia interpunctella]